jgi:hypothetical protein
MRIETELVRRYADGSWPDEPNTLTASDEVTLGSIDFATSHAALYWTAALAI